MAPRGGARLLERSVADLDVTVAANGPELDRQRGAVRALDERLAPDLAELADGLEHRLRRGPRLGQDEVDEVPPDELRRLRRA